jgi:glycosyltransferase involved in cell wall biosynthesis
MARIRLDALPLRFYKHRQQTTFSTGVIGYPIHNHDQVKSADIVNLHWVNDGFVSLRSLKRIAKPIVWTLRDMWPMTGGCHYSMGCDLYKDKCGRCPQLGSKVERDLSRMILNRKMKALSQADVTIVGISSWISACARESTLFTDKRVEVIHNAIDGTVFKPIEKAVAKDILGLPHKKCILVGAQDLSQGYKGTNDLVTAIQCLPGKEEFHLVVLGRKARDLANLGIGVTFLGFLYDAFSLRLAYSAADVFVAPSRVEAFGKMLAEAMSCGTPVVAFDATGPRDIVDHRVNGYLAEAFQASDLALGIDWVLHHEDPKELSWQARQKCERTFAPKVIAQRYLELYADVLNISLANRFIRK